MAGRNTNLSNHKRARKHPRAAKMVIAMLLLVLAVAAALYLRSRAFQQKVMAKVVAELEQVTGGKVDLRAFRWNLTKLEFEIFSLTIHGLETPDVVPYAHVDHMKVRLKILSLVQKQIGLRYLSMDHPVIHIITYPDGTTNQPTPKVKRQSGKTPSDELLDLAIDRAELNSGWLIWNDRRTPLAVAGNNVALLMTYVDIPEKRYDGKISVGTVDMSYQHSPLLKGKAEIDFSMFKNKIALKAIKLATPGSKLEASGQMENYADPRIELSYHASVDVAEFASAANLRQLRAGQADVHGKGACAASGFTASGNIFLKNFQWRHANLQIANVNARMDYSLDDKQISLSHVFANALGGTASGDVRILGWMPGAGRTPAQKGSARFTMADVPVQNVAAALMAKSLLLKKTKPRGIANGTLAVAWVGTLANADVQIAATSEAAQNLPLSDLPVNASFRGTYHAGAQTLDVAQLDLLTRGTALTANGGLGASKQSTQLEVSLRIRDLSAVESFLHAMGREGELPVDLHGQASFNGVLYGKLTAPNARGRIQALDFDTVLAPAAYATVSDVQPVSAPSAQSPSSRVHWDSLVLDMDYTQAGIKVSNAKLRRGTAQIAFDVSAGTRGGKFTAKTPFTARVDLRGADLAEVQSLAGYNYPVTGKMNAEVSASGTPEDVHGNGTVSITGGSIYGEPYRTLVAEVNLAGQEVQATHILFAQNGSQLTGNVAYNLVSRAFRFDIRGKDFDLAQIKHAQMAKLTVAGTASFTAQGLGTLDDPRINAHLDLVGLTLNGQRVGDLSADASTRDHQLQLTVRSNFQNAQIAMDGDVNLFGTFPGAINIRFSQLDMDAILRMFLPGSQVRGHSAIAGTISAQGPFRQPKLLLVEGAIEQFAANIENIKLQNQGPIRFSVMNQVAKIDQLHLAGEGTEVKASGSVDLAGAQRVDVRSDGFINLKLIQAFYPDVLAYGTTSFDLNAGGSISQPNLRGRVQFQNAAISFIDLPNGLSDINGTLVFNQDRLQIQTLRARTGGGYLDLAGFATYRRGLYFDLTATGRDVRSRYPDGMSTSLNADLRLQGAPKNALLSGDVLVTKFAMTPRFDFALYLARSKQLPTIPNPNSIADNVRLDVHVTSTPQLQVETSLAKLSGDVDLRIRGTAPRPAVLGRVNIVDGDVFFNGTKYHLERGEVAFANPVRIEPVVNVEASTRKRDYDITLGFHGSVDKLSTTYRSEPPLPSADIVALLAFGRTREEELASQSSTSTLTETASNAILGQALNYAVSNRAQRLFGISKVKIDPQLGNNPGASAQCQRTCVTIEQQVGDNITVTYVTNLSQSTQQSFQVEYNINRNVSVQASRDQNAVVGMDLRIRQRKR